MYYILLPSTKTIIGWLSVILPAALLAAEPLIIVESITHDTFRANAAVQPGQYAEVVNDWEDVVGPATWQTGSFGKLPQDASRAHAKRSESSAGGSATAEVTIARHFDVTDTTISGSGSSSGSYSASLFWGAGVAARWSVALRFQIPKDIYLSVKASTKATQDSASPGATAFGSAIYLARRDRDVEFDPLKIGTGPTFETGGGDAGAPASADIQRFCPAGDYLFIATIDANCGKHGALPKQGNGNTGMTFRIEASPVPDPVRKYAPLVYLHSEDQFRPQWAENYLAASTLIWSHQGGNDHEEPNAINPLKLGRGGYSHSPKKWPSGIIPPGISIDHDDRHVFTTRNFTRPYEKTRQPPLNNPNLEREGFFIDPPNEEVIRNGKTESSPSTYTGVPAYYQYIPKQYVAYWFFYPYNRYPIPEWLSPEVKWFLEQFGEHEGDWEHIEIKLGSDDKAIEIYHSSHEGEQMPVPWASVRKVPGTEHPIIYSAKGSHASYPTSGQQSRPWVDVPKVPVPLPVFILTPDFTDEGPAWKTWELLADVFAQPWYGYEGAWGEVGEFGMTTGPLGPSPRKRLHYDPPNRRPAPDSREIARLRRFFNAWTNHDLQDGIAPKPANATKLITVTLKADASPTFLRDAFGNPLVKQTETTTENGSGELITVPPGEVTINTNPTLAELLAANIPALNVFLPLQVQIQKYPVTYDLNGRQMVYVFGGGKTNALFKVGDQFVNRLKSLSDEIEPPAGTSFSGFVYKDAVDVTNPAVWRHARSFWNKGQYLNRVSGKMGAMLQRHVIGSYVVAPTQTITGRHMGASPRPGANGHPLDDYGWGHGLLENSCYACFNVLGRDDNSFADPRMDETYPRKSGAQSGFVGAILPAGTPVRATDVTWDVPSTETKGGQLLFRLCIVDLPGKSPESLTVPVALWIAEPNLDSP